MVLPKILVHFAIVQSTSRSQWSNGSLVVPTTLKHEPKDRPSQVFSSTFSPIFLCPTIVRQHMMRMRGGIMRSRSKENSCPWNKSGETLKQNSFVCGKTQPRPVKLRSFNLRTTTGLQSRKVDHHHPSPQHSPPSKCYQLRRFAKRWQPTIQLAPASCHHTYD
ncbi:hypothetical protein BDR07DRAFT_1422251 [Suillus spraguei]|nr:hypothetical protein BDR07DRAFT_1422251 [Suillus spraguei]